MKVNHILQECNISTTSKRIMYEKTYLAIFIKFVDNSINYLKYTSNSSECKSNHSFSRMINFIFVKGYILRIKNQNFFNAIKMKKYKINLKEVTIENCNIFLEISSQISKNIIMNRKKIRNISYIEDNGCEYKSSILILKVISSCRFLDKLNLKMNNENNFCTVGKDKLLYSYLLNHKRRLATLRIQNEYLKGTLNYDFFNELSTLKELSLIEGIIDFNALVIIIEKLGKLNLQERFSFFNDFLIGKIKQKEIEKFKSNLNLIANKINIF